VCTMIKFISSCAYVKYTVCLVLHLCARSSLLITLHKMAFICMGYLNSHFVALLLKYVTSAHDLIYYETLLLHFFFDLSNGGFGCIVGSTMCCIIQSTFVEIHAKIHNYYLAQQQYGSFCIFYISQQLSCQALRREIS